MDQNIGVIQSPQEIAAIGHRVVHGGERFSQPTVITADVQETIKKLIPLAPLHNPANLTGIEVAIELFPQATQVAVFDTAFHQTMPPQAYRYAIPNQLYEEHAIRSYGFHGTSHLYVTNQAIAYLGQSPRRRGPADTNLIIAHLGNGCSITAVRGGKSVDTSMGFSPLAGLIMGTRSGDIDPAIPFFLGTSLDMSFAEIDKLLNKQSGLLGLTGQNDLRDIEERQAQGEAAAQLALEMYAYRLKKYIGAYFAALGRVDALVFTAGVGQHSDVIRALSCTGLENLGIILDEEKNLKGPTGPVTEIQAESSPVKVLIIPTNEELEIANQAVGVLRGE
jgi:acetate kinase